GGADPDHDGDVDRSEEGGQDAVDHRLVDDDVDVVQPVLEDGDGGGNGERQEPNDRQVAGTDAWDAGHDARGHDEAAVCEPPNLLALITRGPAAPDEEGGGAYEREQEDEQERALLDGDREAIGVRQA